MFLLAILTVDMFPPTDSAKKVVDMFPYTDRPNEIHSVLSSHVETVCLLTRK